MTDRGPSRLERVKPVLACPACEGDLRYEPDSAICAGCDERYRIANDKIYFVPIPDRDDGLDKVKGRLKGLLGRWYYTIGVTLLAPTFPFAFGRQVRRRVDPAEKIVVNIGCGNHRIDDDTIHLDLFDYDAVDVVCDLAALPFKPDSVDAFVSRSVLEHVPEPSAIVAQLHRCTKVGGLGMHLVPFLMPFHASPHDYQRYTHRGLAELFARWDLVSQTNPTGPVTYALLGLVEFLSVLLSFGIARIRPYMYLLLCVLLFPVKFLDVLFINRKSFLTMAPSIFSVVRKANG